MSDQVKNIVVVGGGAAGWLAASVIAADHRENNAIAVTLVESPDVAMLGVGEGTWPTMRDTLKRIGIRETDFIRRCSASFKQASKFIGWTTGKEGDSYYHPFTPPEGETISNMAYWWSKELQDKIDFSYLVGFQPKLCDTQKAPKQARTPEYAAVANYGYHLDAGAFAQLLMEHGTENLGIKHILDHVTGVVGQDNGDIKSVTLKEKGDLTGDLFVDCTGSAALLIKGHFDSQLISQRHVLFNDTAIAMQVPYDTDDAPIESATLSTAQKAGWIWDIGLQNRRGIGHVFASKYMENQEAEEILRSYVAKIVGKKTADKIEARTIKFNPGYREEFWRGNCVAVGMSAGFLEPLEASQLVMIELASMMISEQLPRNRELMDIVAQRFNDHFTYKWERIIDFLKLHYILSQRDDSQYWRDIKSLDHASSRLCDQLALWKYNLPSLYDFNEAKEVFGVASYRYVMFGMGFLDDTEILPMAGDSREKAMGVAQENAKKVEKYMKGLPTNRQLLDHLSKNDLPAI